MTEKPMDIRHISFQVAWSLFETENMLLLQVGTVTYFNEINAPNVW